MRVWMMPWVVVAIPFIGAAFTPLLWSSLYRMKSLVLSAVAVTLLAVTGLSWALNEPFDGMPFMWLLPLAAFFSLLGQPLHQDNRAAWLMTLILLGSGLGILTAQGPIRHILLAALLGVLCWLIYRHQVYHRQNGVRADVWRGLGSYAVGLASAVLALVLPASLSSVANLIVCATLLPLFPLHSGFIAVLTGLPGNLPAFLVLLLPALGFHSLLLLLPNLTVTILHTAALLALAGASYGSLRALIQPRALPRLSYGGLAFFSVLWWYVADTATAPSQAVVYLSAVGLAMSGLLLAWYSLRARYGDIDARAFGGLVYSMPRFSTLLVLLALAALGMPPFGVFSGFMGMLLNPAFTPSGSFAVIMIVWFCASWYFMDWVQELVFGRPRSDIRHEDLRRTEWASLFMLLLLLLVLGTAPSRLFQAGAVTPPASVASQSVTWTR